MRGSFRLVTWEVVLLLASVPVFRGLWLLMDEVELLARPPKLAASLVVGLAVAVVALREIHRDS